MQGEYLLIEVATQNGQCFNKLTKELMLAHASGEYKLFKLVETDMYAWNGDYFVKMKKEKIS